MIDSMYNVMQRIAELSERFGLKRQGVETPTGNFGNQLNNVIERDIEHMRNTKDPFESYVLNNNMPTALVKSMMSAESGFDPLMGSPINYNNDFTNAFAAYNAGMPNFRETNSSMDKAFKSYMDNVIKTYLENSKDK